MQTQNIKLELKGTPITLKTTADPNKVRQVVQIARERIESVEKKAGNAAPHLIALLALMELAEEYVEAKSRSMDHGKRLREKTHHLFKLVEAEMK